MSDVQTSPPRLAPEPLPDDISSAQPGGGCCYSIELAWGHVRRWWLRTFRSGHVARMAATRRGDPTGCPHPVLDPRDLKFFRNRCTAHWLDDDDPFQWRDRLPVTRWGLAELLIMGTPMVVLAVALVATGWWYLAVAPAVVLGWLVWFFRDPQRAVPQEAGLVVSPADGVVAEVTPLEFDEFIGGPAVRIGIFLSIFNVHLNRAPERLRVIRLRYTPGKFLNALNPASAWENEAMWIGFEACDAPHRRMIVRQIAGLFARRIVCNLRPGQECQRGEKFGMIKLGSRTELIVPAGNESFGNLIVVPTVGEVVKAGSTVLARYTKAES
ncbi:MAG TPA: phosphatidylserine decarboxylase [Pirellulales bacterium]|nr:phosphatidylserine decarboxylase [Pirellulales bacterium]